MWCYYFYFSNRSEYFDVSPVQWRWRVYGAHSIERLHLKRICNKNHVSQSTFIIVNNSNWKYFFPLKKQSLYKQFGRPFHQSVVWSCTSWYTMTQHSRLHVLAPPYQDQGDWIRSTVSRQRKPGHTHLKSSTCCLMEKQNVIVQTISCLSVVVYGLKDRSPISSTAGRRKKIVPSNKQRHK